MASKENNPGLIRPSNFPGASFGGSKRVKEVGPDNPPRRALRDVLNITKDTVNPCVINKRCFSSHMVQQCPKEPEALSLTLASNPSGDQEAKKLTLYAANPSGPVDSNIIDVEDGGDEASDAAVPMYLKHTEAPVLDETYRMEEDDPVMDIDSSSSKDTLSVAHHVVGIYALYRNTYYPVTDIDSSSSSSKDALSFADYIVDIYAVHRNTEAAVDNSGTTEYKEFIAATIHCDKAELGEHLAAAFRYFNEDGSGYITVDELQQACTEHNTTDILLDDI